jgi:hypothetical protein
MRASDDPTDVLRGTNPGEVLSYLVPADQAPAVGLRMMSVILPKDPDGGPPKRSWLSADRGPWEVVQVEPIPGDAGQVKVYIRLYG